VGGRLGFALRHSNDTTKNLINDLSNAVTFIVTLVIRFAPIGIFGLVSSTLATTGFGALWGYAQLLLVLIGCMAVVALVINRCWSSCRPAATRIRWC